MNWSDQGQGRLREMSVQGCGMNKGSIAGKGVEVMVKVTCSSAGQDFIRSIWLFLLCFCVLSYGAEHLI